MKKFRILIIFLTVIILTSCGTRQEFEIAYREEVPDSLKTEYRIMIENLSKEAHPAHLTGKSRDFGDIIRAAEHISFKAYSVPIRGLRILNYSSGSYVGSVFIPEDQLNEYQSKIMEQLLNGVSRLDSRNLNQ